MILETIAALQEWLVVMIAHCERWQILAHAGKAQLIVGNLYTLGMGLGGVCHEGERVTRHVISIMIGLPTLKRYKIGCFIARDPVKHRIFEVVTSNQTI